MKAKNLDTNSDSSVDGYVDEQIDKHYKEWCEAVSQDLQQIAVLHDREVDETLIEALWEVDFPYNLGYLIKGNADSNSTERDSDKLRDAQHAWDSGRRLRSAHRASDGVAR